MKRRRGRRYVKMEFQKGALREVKAAAANGKVDLKHIERQVLMKFEAYWSTASKTMVSQPAEVDVDEDVK